MKDYKCESLTNEEVKKIFELIQKEINTASNLKEEYIAYRNYCIFYIMITFGWTYENIINLRLKDVHLDRRVIVLKRHHKHYHSCKLGSNITEVFEKYNGLRKQYLKLHSLKENRAYFYTYTCEEITTTGLSIMMRKYFDHLDRKFHHMSESIKKYAINNVYQYYKDSLKTEIFFDLSSDEIKRYIDQPRWFKYEDADDFEKNQFDRLEVVIETPELKYADKNEYSPIVNDFVKYLRDNDKCTENKIAYIRSFEHFEQDGKCFNNIDDVKNIKVDNICYFINCTDVNFRQAIEIIDVLNEFFAFYLPDANPMDELTIDALAVSSTSNYDDENEMMTSEEFAELLWEIEENFKNCNTEKDKYIALRDYLMCCLMGFYGMLFDDLENMKLQDITYDGREGNLQCFVSANDRYIKISEKLVKKSLELLGYHGKLTRWKILPDDDYVFKDLFKEGSISLDNFNKSIKNYVRFNFKDITAGSILAFCVSNMIFNGGTLYNIKKYIKAHRISSIISYHCTDNLNGEELSKKISEEVLERLESLINEKGDT